MAQVDAWSKQNIHGPVPSMLQCKWTIIYDPEYMTERSSNIVDCNFIIRMLYMNAY